jgi:hypothetical protein
MSRAVQLLKEMVEQVTEIGYNCECKKGGVDAISIDLDWLQHHLNKAIELIKGETE